MKIKSLWCCAVLVSTVFLLPLSGSGQEYKNDLALKTGIYAINGDLENFDLGLNGEVAYGRSVNSNLKMEFGLGYFRCERFFSRIKPGLGLVTEDSELSVVPITVTAKVVLPSGKWDVFGGAGFGLYLVDYKSSVRGSSLGSFTFKDEDTAFGAHFVAGANYNVSERWYVGFEGKYIFTTDVRFEQTVSGTLVIAEGDMDGMLATFVVG